MSQEDNPLVEIQRRKTQIGRQLIQAQGQLTMKTRIANSTRLTIAEIDKLPETTKTYRTVGRMFLATPLAQVKEGLQKVLSESKSDMGQLEVRCALRLARRRRRARAHRSHAAHLHFRVPRTV